MPINYTDPWLQLSDFDKQRLMGGDLSAITNPDAESSPYDMLAQPSAPKAPMASEMNASYMPAAASSEDPLSQDVSASLQAPMGYGGTQSASMGVSHKGPADPMSDASYKKILDQINMTGTRGLDDQRAGLGDMQGRIDALKNKPLQNDYTGLMMLGDFLNNGKTNFVGSYRKPMNEEDRQAMLDKLTEALQKQKGALSADEVKLLTTQLHGQYLTDAAREKATLGRDAKASDQEEKDAMALMKAIETEKSSGRFTAVGKAQANLYQAERIQQLLDQYKSDPNNMPLKGPSSLSEMAIGLNSLLSANGGSEESRASLIPSSARGKYSTVEQYLTNEPAGAGMAEFVKNAQDTLNREKNANAGQINGYLKKMDTMYGTGRLAKTNPTRYRTIVQAAFDSPSLKSGLAAGSPAAASSAPPASKGVVDSKTLNDYAATHKMPVDEASKLLQAAGYTVGQ